MRSSHGLAGIIVVALVCGAREAQAHAFALRYDLPLPLWLYLVGTGATVAVSVPFVAWLVGPAEPATPRRQVRLNGLAGARLLLNPTIGYTVRALSVALFALLIAAGLLGTQGDPFDNVLPTAVWVIWWVGLAYVSAFLGNVWRLINPWAIVGEWAGGLSRRLGGNARGPGRDPLPWLEAWPAVVLFLAFGWLELVWLHNAVPAQLAIAILIYSAITWTGMAIFGVDTWRELGEAFSLFFGLFGRFAPVDAQTLALRPYGAGLVVGAPVSTSMLCFVVLALAMVSFDGMAETPVWAELTGAALAAMHRVGLLEMLGYVRAGALIKTVGLVLTPLVFLGVYLAVCRLTVALMATPAIAPGPAAWTTVAIARRFVLTLVPIAIAYHLAHYISYLLIYGQESIRLTSDPFGFGWDLFGTAGFQPDIAIVSARFVWITSVVAIVLGHIAAIWLAHVTAIRTFAGPRLALRSHHDSADDRLHHAQPLDPCAADLET
jgi:hypothetical protein